MHDTTPSNEVPASVDETLDAAADLYLDAIPDPPWSCLHPNTFAVHAEQALSRAIKRREPSSFDSIVRPALLAALEAIADADECYLDSTRYGQVSWIKGCIESLLT